MVPHLWMNLSSPAEGQRLGQALLCIIYMISDPTCHDQSPTPPPEKTVSRAPSKGGAQETVEVRVVQEAPSPYGTEEAQCGGKRGLGHYMSEAACSRCPFFLL